MKNFKTIKSPINAKRVGVYFGQFNMFHRGHLSVATQALMENDGAVIVVSGAYREDDRSMKINLPLNKRVQYINELFQDEVNVKVSELDETNIPSYPDGWTPWVNKLIEIVEDGVNYENDQEFVVYVGNEEYISELEKRLPINWSIQLVDRSLIPISSTLILSDIDKYWDYITPPYRRHFTKRIAVMGSASTGKSTLVKRLAKVYSAQFTEEAARTHEIENFLVDEHLTVEDYVAFLTRQFNDMNEVIKSPLNNGKVFLDTDALVTLVYMKMYMPEALPILEPLAKYYIEHQQFDLIFVIPPITDYIDDGFRAMEWEDSRYDFHNALMAELEKFNLLDKVRILDANDKDGGYYARFKQATGIIADELNIKL